MSQKLTKNEFFKALNTNTDKNKISGDQYIEAYNVELAADGSFFGLKNIRGTTNVQQIVADSSVESLGVFPNRYKIGDNYYNCLSIFTAKNSGLFKIWCYDTENDTLYELYEESTTSDYLSDDRIVDGKTYPENGIDILYFTDNYNEYRKLRCEIPLPYTANFLSEFDLSLQRRGGNGSVSFDSIVSGSLLSGTYQFAYRMVNPTTKTLTKWSSLTNPIHVYSANNTGTNVPLSGIGLPTAFGIQIDIAPTSDELANFPYFQLAVVENIYPTGAQSITEGENTSFVASLLPLELIANRNNYIYKANAKIGLIPITDLTIDLAQIDTGKTINVHLNRLWGGNIKYKDLEFDNGTPQITSGSIVRRTSGAKDSYVDHNFCSKYIGYFRNEVYRFGIVYKDKYGNKFPAKALDLSSVADNQISGATDMKFPDRSFSPTYSLFDSATQNMQGLGLQLNGIVNHPSEAVSFEIVRVPRKKNILFQTPVIPMMKVVGIGAFDNYPSTYTVASGSGTIDKTSTDAQPMTSGLVYIPQNYLWPEFRAMIKNSATTGTGLSTKKAGEVQMIKSSLLTNYYSLFPPSNMYGSINFVPTGSEKLSYVDYALLKISVSDKNSAVLAGDDINTSIAATFYGLRYDEYFFDPISTGKSIDSTYKNVPIIDYEFLDNLSTGASVAGSSVLKYNDLSTKNYTFGYEPTANRTSVIQVNSPIGSTVNSSQKVFLAGTLNADTLGNFIFGSSGPVYEAISNKYISEYTNFVNGGYVAGIAIANVELGLGDDRYGSPESNHEYISTGTSYTFSDFEIANIIAGNPVPVSVEVWGGDCFVSPHVFKVQDSSYSVVANEKFGGASPTIVSQASKWGTVYKNSEGTAVLAMPVAVKNAATYIQVVLESEYNGAVRDKDILSTTDNGQGVTIFTPPDDETGFRTPLTYTYNINISKQNDEKIYVPKEQFSFIQNEFRSRVIYSDLKIYNSSEQGFDIFRALNFVDLEESRGSLTKLAVQGDNLYGIQTDGIVYLPVGQTQLQQTDAGSIAVGITGVVGRPIVINNKRGGQHLRGIVETGDLIYIPDVKNKAVYVVGGPSFSDENIISSRDNDTLFVSMFNSPIVERKLIGVYDPVKNHYWVANNSTTACQVFNNKLGVWVSTYEFNSPLFGGAYTNQKLYLVGRDSDTSLKVYEMYTGDYTQLFGTNVVPRVKVSINPDQDFSKVFDNIMIASTDRLDEAEFVVERESALGNQVITTSDFDIDPVEGNYRIKVLLDSATSRARGMRMLGTFKWGTLPATLSTIWTKYRLSPRTPF